MVAAELYLDAIPREARYRHGPARPTRRRRLQAVRRDFAFLVPAGLAGGHADRARLRGADKQAIAEVSLFDVFTGAGVPEGRSRSASR